MKKKEDNIEMEVFFEILFSVLRDLSLILCFPLFFFLNLLWNSLMPILPSVLLSSYKNK